MAGTRIFDKLIYNLFNPWSNISWILAYGAAYKAWMIMFGYGYRNLAIDLINHWQIVDEAIKRRFYR